jgi:hypothetical protein
MNLNFVLIWYVGAELNEAKETWWLHNYFDGYTSLWDRVGNVAWVLMATQLSDGYTAPMATGWLQDT